MPTYEYRNGERVEVPDLVITESCDLHEKVTKTVVIGPGVTLTLHDRVSGTVQVTAGATLEAHADVSGTVHVAAGAHATFYNHINGPCKWSEAESRDWLPLPSPREPCGSTARWSTRVLGVCMSAAQGL